LLLGIKSARNKNKPLLNGIYMIFLGKNGFKRLIALITLLLPLVVHANNTIIPRLVLTNIKQLSRQEHHDEIYFLVADLEAKSHALYIVPGYQDYITSQNAPHSSGNAFLHVHQHWKEKNLSSARGTLLWKRTLVNQQGTQLMLSMVESDVPPWDLDDTLGTVKIDLLNNHGHLEIKFLPYSHVILEQKKLSASGIEYHLRIHNDDANYLVVLSLIYQDRKYQPKKGASNNEKPD